MSDSIAFVTPAQPGWFVLCCFSDDERLPDLAQPPGRYAVVLWATRRDGTTIPITAEILCPSHPRPALLAPDGQVYFDDFRYETVTDYVASQRMAAQRDRARHAAKNAPAPTAELSKSTPEKLA